MIFFDQVEERDLFYNFIQFYLTKVAGEGREMAVRQWEAF